jgi:hypothetical protein
MSRHYRAHSDACQQRRYAINPEKRCAVNSPWTGILHAQDYELAYLASANTAHAIAHRAAKLGDLSKIGSNCSA